jgi:cobalt-zinc-cadmium efflux system protein
MTSRNIENKKRLRLVFILTFTYLIAEVIGGVMTKSLALLADAGHMLTDVGGLALALFAIKMSERKATQAKTYGYYRTEILAAVMNALVLFGISFYILYEAWQRFSNPPEVESTPMLIVAGIGLGINIAGMLIMRKGSNESLNMKGAYFEVLSDALSSLGVIAASLIMMFTGWYYADPILSAAIGLFILPRTWGLLKDGINVLLEGVPKDIDMANLREAIKGVKGVQDVHDLHVWALTSGMNALSAHVVLADGNSATANEILSLLNETITSKFNIQHTTIQLENKDFKEEEMHL